jgi:hypothetical protein|tara:strand:- start:2729 stop:3229 length:501 start_codon:yes stop_codon:yes gene_type:complete
MNLKYIEKGKLYNSEDYGFEIKEYFTTISIARNYIECCKDDVSINGNNKTHLLDWLANFDDTSVSEYNYHNPFSYHTICLWIKNGSIVYHSGGLGFKTTRRTTNFLKRITYDEGEVIIMKIIHPKFSDYIEEIDDDISYDMDMQIVDEHEEVGEELEGEEHVGDEE